LKDTFKASKRSRIFLSWKASRWSTPTQLSRL